MMIIAKIQSNEHPLEKSGVEFIFDHSIKMKKKKALSEMGTQNKALCARCLQETRKGKERRLYELA